MTDPVDFITSRTQPTKTALVWDGGAVTIPQVVGEPLPGRMIGTDGERLCELGGRLCYDSMSKKGSRMTAAYHQHILDVGHYSVFRHYTWVIRLCAPGRDQESLSHVVAACANRPGVLVCNDPSNPRFIRITINAQAALEWEKWSKIGPRLSVDPWVAENVTAAVRESTKRLLPTIARLADLDTKMANRHRNPGFEIVAPMFDHEKTISLYLCMGRGASHEMVRHAFSCGISMRSTRYCEESESPWLLHPAIRTYLVENENTPAAIDLELAIQNAEGAGRFAYHAIRKVMEPWLKSKLNDAPYAGQTALKQSRGAARGYLGNALETEMIFSAPVSMWKSMLTMRASEAADGEICDIFADMLKGEPGQAEAVLGALRASRYSDRFADLALTNRQDGTALCLSGGGAK